LDQATLTDIGDGNYRLDHKGRSLNLTADELGQMTGGGFLIGAMEEFKSVIIANQREFSQATRFNGVSPKEFLGIEKPQGVPEVLPQDVLRLATEMGLRPVYYGATEISSFCNAQSCEAMLYDHLVTGATITESTNGQVIYVLPGQPGTTAVYKFDGLPDGVRPAFFIAGDNNQYGVASGTVMALFYRGGGKTGAEVLNLKNPLKPLVDEPNRSEVVVIDKGLTMTTFDAGGNVIEEQSVALEPPEPSVWQVAGKDYLVSIGENNIPEYQFVEGEGWQKVEQISMVDAFGNIVPGWVVEKSDVWEGEISQASYDANAGRYDPVSGLSFALMSNVTLKQWQLMEFINSDGVKMQRLNLTLIFKNDQGKLITVKAGMPELNSAASSERLTPRRFIDSLAGGQTKTIGIYWVDTRSTMTPEKLAKLANQYAVDGELCKLSVQVCGLSIGRLGDQKHPASWFDDIYSGLLGDNVNIADETWCDL